MIAVIFEVIPAPGRKQEYLELAEKLWPELERLDGFISIERFKGLTTPGQSMSLSIWRDEAAVKAWPAHLDHQAAQIEGPREVFEDFRIRVAGVMRDSSMKDCVPAAAE